MGIINHFRDESTEDDDKPLFGRNWLEGSPNLDNNYYDPTSYTEAEAKELALEAWDAQTKYETFDKFWDKHKKK